jgi:hypothetical protein
MLKRYFDRGPERLLPQNLSRISYKEFRDMFSDDDGPVTLLTSVERWNLTREYAQWFSVPRWSGYTSTPSDIVGNIAYQPNPARYLLALLADERDGIPGFKQDPLKKKALLLLMALANRPERFLVPEQDFVWEPVVDYHLMRITARLGLIHIPVTWQLENTARSLTSPEREREIRLATWRAVRKLIRLSERSMAEVDLLLRSARRFCPETERPACEKCALAPACGKFIGLFQPVLRTTNY